MLAHKVILTAEAEKDLENIYRYLAIEKADGINAQKVVDAISERILSLGVFPEGCPIYEPEPNYRVAHVKRYKLFYRVDKDNQTVVVVRIMHSLQQGFREVTW